MFAQADLGAPLKCRRGATAIEYCLIAGGISLAIVAVVFTLGTSLIPVFTNAAAGLTN